MSATCEREIREFINTYRQLPELWNTKSPEYSDRNKKNRAYEILVEKYKPICSLANRKIVTKKINSLRTTYRRDMKKMKQCQVTGEPFKSTSIFFNDLKFLGELVGADDGPTTFSHNQSSNWFDYVDVKPSIPHLIKITEDKRTHEKINDDDSVESYTEPITNDNHHIDEYEALTCSWDLKLRKMDEIQKLLAEELINKILTKGIFNELCRSTDVVDRKEHVCNERSNGVEDEADSDQSYREDKYVQKNKRKSEEMLHSEFDKKAKVPKEDEAFFVSVMPSIVGMTEDEKLDFRMEVLRVIKQIKHSNRLKLESNSSTANR